MSVDSADYLRGACTPHDRRDVTVDTQNRANGQGSDPYGGPQDARWELLSAYVDGEVSDAERATVEAWLREDPAAREMLGELQSLSVTLRSLSAGIPSPNLRAATLQQIASVQPAAPVGTSSQTWFPRWRRRELLAAALGAVASLAVMLIVPWSPQSPGLGFGRYGMVVSHTTGQTLDTLDESQTEFFAASADMRDALPAAPRLMSASAPHEPSSAAARKTMADAQGGLLQPSSVAMAGSVPPTDATLSAEELRSLESWDEVQPYLGLLSQNTTAVANFDLVVLDVKQAADQFEVLLIQNGIPVVIEGARGTDTERSLTKSQPGAKDVAPPSEDAAAEPSLSAVYVEAEGEPITRALQEMVRRRQVLSVKLQPPLQFEDSPTLADADRAEEQLQRALDLKRAYQTRNALLADRADLSLGVSALDQVENRSSDGLMSNAANMPSEKSATAPYSVEGRGARAPAAAAVPLRRGIEESQKLDGARQLASGGGRAETEIDAALTGNYGQRLNLPQPKLNWLEEVQQDQMRRRVADDKAFQNQLAESERSEINRLRSLQQNYQRAASGAVRVLFVMHPAAADADAAGSVP